MKSGVRMKWLALILCLATVPARAEPVDAAIIFVADVSSSMNEQERTFVRQAHAYAVMSGTFLEAVAEGRYKRVALSYVEFGSTAKVMIPWTMIDGPEQAAIFVDALQHLERPVVGTNTAIGRGLEAARGLIATLPWEADKLVVDVVGDGETNEGPLPGKVTPLLVADGAVINGLPVMISPNSAVLEEYYRTEVAAGIGHFVLPVDAINQLPQALHNKLVRELF